MTQDGQFRVIVATTGSTYEEAACRQPAPEGLSGQQAELICAGVLIRETMQPSNRVQIILKTIKGDRLVTDALPDGKNRSIVNPGQGSDDERGGIVQVAYTLRNGEQHNGIVSIGESTDVSEAMMCYLQDSEQITAFVCIEHTEELALRVGGFVVQVTPEATHEGLLAMTRHLEAFEGLADWLARDEVDPEALIAELLEGHEYALLADSPVCFGCTCSHERMLLGISTLLQTDIAELLDEGKGIEVSCDACGEKYEITGEELAALLGGGESDPGTLPN
jgi:redox-regulated HSP33 family molecular chaperone